MFTSSDQVDSFKGSSKLRQLRASGAVEPIAVLIYGMLISSLVAIASTLIIRPDPERLLLVVACRLDRLAPLKCLFILSKGNTDRQQHGQSQPLHTLARHREVACMHPCQTMVARVYLDSSNSSRRGRACQVKVFRFCRVLAAFCRWTEQAAALSAAYFMVVSSALVPVPVRQRTVHPQ